MIGKELTEHPETTWRTIESLYHLGLTKFIGVSNWTQSGLSSFSMPKSIHRTPLITYCLENSIMPVEYSPLGSQDQVPGTGKKVSMNKELIVIAERNGVILVQVLIAWGIKRGYAVLPKSSNPGRIQSNAKLIQLSDVDFAAVNKVAEGRRSRSVNMMDAFGYDVWPKESQ